MKQYVDLVTRILEEGSQQEDRTGVGTISMFGHQSVYNMKDGFPLLTLKKTWMPGVIHELLWLLGNHKRLEQYKDLPLTNIKYLVDNKVHIWDEWADENGNLGPVYGEQWTNWPSVVNDEMGPTFENKITHINQIQIAIDKLKNNPKDRGIMVSAWNVSDLDNMALRPCHALFQFKAEPLTYFERYEIYENLVSQRGGIDTCDVKTEEILDQKGIPKYKLSLQLYQRSADTFLGVPFNIASYSLLLHMVAQVTNMVPAKFIHTFGDAHLYLNHKEQVNDLLQRTLPEDNIKIDFYENKKSASIFVGNDYGPALPKIQLNPKIKDIFDFQYNDIQLLDYNPLKTISAPVAI